MSLSSSGGELGDFTSMGKWEVSEARDTTSVTHTSKEQQCRKSQRAVVSAQVRSCSFLYI